MIQSNYRNVILLGGPADGQRHQIDPRQRFINVTEVLATTERDNPLTPTNALIHTYIVTNLVDVGGVHSVGIRSLNECAVRMLIGAYRSPAPHDSEGNIAEHMILLLGGDSDGRRIPMVNHDHTRCRMQNDHYQLIRLTGNDRKTYRVGVVDAMAVDPVAMLIQGYRASENPAREVCRYCGCSVETPCDVPPLSTCETALNAMSAAYGVAR